MKKIKLLFYRNCAKHIKSFGKTTTIHGFRFIANPNLHWTERFFWLIFVSISWQGSVMLIKAQYNSFINNPISFVVDTNYIDWDTHFPSVAICETESTERVEEVSDKLWGPDHIFNLEEVLKELAFYKGVTYYSSQFCGNSDAPPECIKTNISAYVNLVRRNCEELLSSCSWNGEPFKCCKYFVPMETELGICYAINTAQGRPTTSPMLKMVSNRRTGPGVLEFYVKTFANIYVLNAEDVPSLSSPGTEILSVSPDYVHKRLIMIRDIENDAEVRKISPEKRNCRYTDENLLDVYRYYSYSACTVQCRKNAQLRVCNCTNFFMPNVPEKLKCDIHGIMCLNGNINEISVLKAKWVTRPGLLCDCLPSCTEAEIYTMSDIRTPTNQSSSIVQIELSMLPSERYRRNVVRGILDLVVSAGGTEGLFLGASLLSAVEMIYIFLIRPLCTYYVTRNSDPWFKKFGMRRLEDNNFKPNKI